MSTTGKPKAKYGETVVKPTPDITSVESPPIVLHSMPDPDSVTGRELAKNYDSGNYGGD